MSSSCQLKKGPWTPEEDEILAAHVQKYGEGNWNAVQKHSGLARCGKSCRLRWSNHLRPDLKRGSFSAEEQHKIIELHAKYGNKWSKMALELPGRTDNEIKNFWNTRRKKLDRLGLPLYPHGMTPSQPLNNNQETTLDVSSNQQADASQQTNILEIPMLRFRKQHLLMSRKRKHLPRLPPIPEVSERSTSTASSEQDSDSTFPLPVMQNPQKPLGDSNSSMPCSSSLCSTSPPALFDHDSHEFQGGDCFSGGYACLRGTSSISGAMVTNLHPFQQGSSSSCWDTPASPGLASFHESFDTLTQYKNNNDDDDDNVLAPPDEGTQSELPPPVSPRSNGYMESILFPAKASNVEGGSEDDIANASCMHFCGGDHIEEYSDLRDPTNKDAEFGWFENDKNPYDGTLFAILQHELRRYHCRRK